MKNVIIDNLKQEKKDRQKTVDYNLSEVKGLLAQDTSRDIDIYRQMGISSTFEKKLDEKSKVVTEKKIEEEFGCNDIIHIDDIEKVAVKFNLRFLETKRYKGHVETGLAKQVEEFCEKHNLKFGNTSSDFYILAREEDFNLEERPLPPVPAKDFDPILFYRVMPDDYNDRNYYKIVTKWGNDLSPARALTSWKYKNNSTVFTHTLFRWFLYVYSLFTVIALMGIDGFTAVSPSRMIASLFFAGIFATLSVIDVDDWKPIEGTTTKEMWNDKHKRNTKWYRF